MRVAITGATGYVGQAVVHKLLRRDHEVRALVRRPERAGALRDQGAELVEGDLGERVALRTLLEGASAVIHLVGIIVETERHAFESVHVAGTEAVLEAAREAGTPLLLHMSALGARGQVDATRYHQTKWRAEEAVRAGRVPYAIFRPSLIAGPGSPPLKTMVDMIRFSPVVPVIGDGRYQLQPIWLGDVAEAFARALERADLRGSFDLAGTEPLTYHRMLDHLETALGVRRRRIAVPVGVARFAAAAGTTLPSVAPITPEQLQMLLEGSTTNDNAIATRFGIAPRAFADVADEICAPYAARQAAAS
ncbi:MAG TPA: NAD(P)H-binding protein [Gemmatimonadales bacterium]|nr:NAD(P)H-binding protein [Gemmatimonadales bacterium]